MTLYLIRHAKTEKRDPGTADEDRELTSEGRRAAGEIGKTFAVRLQWPALVLCSTATRARQTYELAASALDYTGALTYSPELYSADGSQLFRLIAYYGGHADPLALIGHNPAIEDFLAELCGAEKKIKTGSIAIVTFDGDRWDLLSTGSGRLNEIVDPRIA